MNVSEKSLREWLDLLKLLDGLHPRRGPDSIGERVERALVEIDDLLEAQSAPPTLGISVSETIAVTENLG